MTSRLLLDERILADGSHSRTYATLGEADHVRIVDDTGAEGVLSVAALERVMVRYGMPLDGAIRLDGDALDLGGGRRLRRLRFHAVVDADGRDYLVWERTDAEPLCVLATHATAAVRYLVLRLDGERSQETEG